MANINNLKPFKSGSDPRRNTNGAPRKLVTTLNMLGYLSHEVNSTILNTLAMTEDEAKEIANGEDYSILERITAAALLRDMEKGSLWNLELLLSRTIGKPKQTGKFESNNKIEFSVSMGKTII
jgi:hypothetical protein